MEFTRKVGSLAGPEEVLPGVENSEAGSVPSSPGPGEESQPAEAGADPNLDEIRAMLTFEAPTEDQGEAYLDLRDAAFIFAEVILERSAPGSHGAAIIKLVETLKTANAAVAPRHEA